MNEQQLDAFAVDDAELEHLLEKLEQLEPGQKDDVLAEIPLNLMRLIAIFESELKGTVKNPLRHAQRMVFVMANYLGGKKLYLPRNSKLKQLLRDIEIYNAHCKGATIKQLMETYKLTDVQLYAIISNQTKLGRARRQSDMFPDLLPKKDKNDV